jgi:hypothetical protein
MLTISNLLLTSGRLLTHLLKLLPHPRDVQMASIGGSAERTRVRPQIPRINAGHVETAFALGAGELDLIWIIENFREIFLKKKFPRKFLD